MDIFLKLFNYSSDRSMSDVVIFQSNASSDFDTLCIAWKVIRQCGRGNYHPFLYPTECQISASDSYGNFTPHLEADPGQLFHVFTGPSGNQLALKGHGPNCREISLENDLQRGAIAANIFKDDRLFARKTAIAPTQKACFAFKPTLLISACSQIVEGQFIDSAVMSTRQTELSLMGIARADIIMTGGGPDAEATPFTFRLENISWA